MTVYLSNRDGDGKTNEEGHLRLLSKILEGQVLGADSLKVTQNSPLGLSVLVQAGEYRLETSGGDYAYQGWLDDDEAVTITTPDVSNPRITVIVLYVDKSEVTAPAPPNNPGVAKLMAVNGSASSTPIAPSGAAIQSAVGSGNPYMILAEVTVGAGVTQITNSNITDTRETIQISEEILSASSLTQLVGPLLMPVGTIYENASNASNPATLLGFGTWSAFGQGRVTVGVDSGDSDFGTVGATPGAKTVTLTEAQMPNHTHGIDPPGTFTSSAGNHNHRMPIAITGGTGAGGDVRGVNIPSNGLSNYNSTDAGTHNHYIDISPFTSGNTGNSQAHNNIQPSVVVYRWRRTA